MSKVILSAYYGGYDTWKKLYYDTEKNRYVLRERLFDGKIRSTYVNIKDAKKIYKDFPNKLAPFKIIPGKKIKDKLLLVMTLSEWCMLCKYRDDGSYCSDCLYNTFEKVEVTTPYIWEPLD